MFCRQSSLVKKHFFKKRSFTILCSISHSCLKMQDEMKQSRRNKMRGNNQTKLPTQWREKVRQIKEESSKGMNKNSVICWKILFHECHLWTGKALFILALIRLLNHRNILISAIFHVNMLNTVSTKMHVFPSVLETERQQNMLLQNDLNSKKLKSESKAHAIIIRCWVCVGWKKFSLKHPSDCFFGNSSYESCRSGNREIQPKNWDRTPLVS